MGAIDKNIEYEKGILEVFSWSLPGIVKNGSKLEIDTARIILEELQNSEMISNRVKFPKDIQIEHAATISELMNLIYSRVSPKNRD